MCKFSCGSQNRRYVHSNRMDGVLSLEKIMQVSVNHTEFGHFSSGVLNSKYNNVSHRKLNVLVLRQ